MRLKFTYRAPGGAPTDLIAELESQATVGQLATHLALARPAAGVGQSGLADGHPVTLSLEGPRSQLLDPQQPVLESPLASGAVVSLARAARSWASIRSEDEAAVRLRVISGPDAGKQFLLAAGSAVIGREPGCDVQLTDPMVSRRHIRLNVSDAVELIDQGSANGVMVGLMAVQRTTLGSGDVVTVGNTEFEVTRLHRSGQGTGTVRFVRPARLTPRHEGREFQTPAPPERKAAQRFPTIALIVPLIIGSVLYLVTRQVASLAFIALSPLMLIGSALEARWSTRREFNRAVQVFESELSALAHDVRRELDTEREARLREHPSADECATAIVQRSDLLWSRRPDLPGFAQLRIGVGRAPSRSSINPPASSSTPYELLRRIEETTAGLAEVDGVPITADLSTGALGIAAPRVTQLATARALVTQLVAQHSPAELVVCGLIGEHKDDWDWLKWLPHTTSAHSPLVGRHVTAAPAESASLLVELEALLELRAGEDSGTRPDYLPRVVLLVATDPTAAHHRLVELAERGHAVGIHVVWLTTDRAHLPASCKVFVEVMDGTLAVGAATGRIGYVDKEYEVTNVRLDALDAERAASIARGLSPVDDVGARVEDDSDLPRSISQFATLADSTLGSRAESVIERWQANSSILSGPRAPERLPRKAGTLRAVVGMTAGGPHALDLRTDGPHALVGGSTNSGKSELLQSWILSLAATHSPQRVTFLLVDYKGGSAFADCVRLPHTIGLVTDLGPHLVRRALTSLRAELRYRERLLHQHDAKDLIELEKQGTADAPPSLIIVVDEFATLAREVPEFMDGVVDVAARGRSLGLHLILATQQPSGVIKGSLRANTNLRLALRVTDEQDSLDVIGDPAAAAFDPLIPGRAMSRSGPTRLVGFQTSFAGGWTSDEPEPPGLLLEELTLAQPARWAPPDVESPPKDRDATDIKRLVVTITEANQIAQLPAPRRAWLEVLPNSVDIAHLPRSRRDEQLVYALGDDPDHQSQPPMAFFPDREGNLAVFGAGGSGKSTLLRALAVSAAFAQRGGPCHVYGLDFGTRALQMLEVLPHVGSIVPGGDHERVTRLIQWLRNLVDERTVRFAAANASTITHYRALAGRPQEPRIVLLVDNIGAFRQAYETSTDRQHHVDLLTSIATDGRPVGVHLAISAAERTALHTTLSSAVQRRVVMRMPTEDDYAMLGVSTDTLSGQSAPGRAIDGQLEIQVGILGMENDDASQARRLKDMAVALRAAGATEAPPIRSLPTDVPLAVLLGSPANDHGAVPIGVASTTLDTVGVDTFGGFLVTGPPGSGRSTALRTLLAAVRSRLPSAEFHYFGHRRSPLAALPGWTTASVSLPDITQRAEELSKLVADRTDDEPQVVVVVENAGDLVMSAAELPLQALVKACIAGDHWFVAEGEVSSVRSSSGYLGLVKSSRRGLSLQPDQETGTTLFNTPFPRVNRAEFPEGRGLLVGSGRTTIIQVARIDTSTG